MDKGYKKAGHGQVGNADPKVVESFGQEWSALPQEQLDASTREKIWRDYFSIFPWDRLPENAVGADVGCGSGRWATIVASRVGTLHLVDASCQALEVARRNLATTRNVRFHHASVDDLPFEDGSLDFAYALGVLHHVPDTQEAIRSIARKLKKGGVFLVYLYYSFENRGMAFRCLWKVSDILRMGISRLPFPIRYGVTQLLAGLVYYPLARVSWLLGQVGVPTSSWPLSYYRDKPFYVMRTDALDRFGTRLERRFSREQIADMLAEAGFVDVRFSDTQPFWCAVGIKGC